MKWVLKIFINFDTSPRRPPSVLTVRLARLSILSLFVFLPSSLSRLLTPHYSSILSRARGLIERLHFYSYLLLLASLYRTHLPKVLHWHIRARVQFRRNLWKFPYQFWFIISLETSVSYGFWWLLCNVFAFAVKFKSRSAVKCSRVWLNVEWN